MKATIKNPQHDGKVRQNRKENHFYREYAAIIPGKRGEPGRAIVTLRIYATDRTAYACLWAHDGTGAISISGGGKAGGYGYHRPSQAAENAFYDAGVRLSEGIGGVGDTAIESAVVALAKRLTRKAFVLHCAHA